MNLSSLRIILIAAFFLITSASSWARASSEDVPHAPPISIATLLAEPVSKIPQRVQVAGFLVLEFEGQALYLHREDYQQGLTRNAIRIALTPEQEMQYKDFSGSYVLVEASFKKVQNSEDIFTGSLFDVRRVVKLLSRR